MVATGLARTTVNERVKRIRRMFRWLAANELVPATVYGALKAVDGLRRGETEAREPDPVRPVEISRVEATLPYLPDVVSDMCQLQLVTGMRSGELCRMRPKDIDRSGSVWRYTPSSHKTQYRGKERGVFLGRRAQAILLRYLARDPEMCCFRPVDSEAKRRAAQHAARVTPLSCGNKPGSNRKRAARRQPGDRYTPVTYYRAIVRGCDRAFAPPAPLARRKGETARQWRERLSAKERKLLAEHRKAHRWTAHQLRHTMATRVRQQYGIEAAGILLGHSKLNSTEVYAERDYALAVRVAKKLG